MEVPATCSRLTTGYLGIVFGPKHYIAMLFEYHLLYEVARTRNSTLYDQAYRFNKVLGYMG